MDIAARFIHIEKQRLVAIKADFKKVISYALNVRKEAFGA